MKSEKILSLKKFLFKKELGSKILFSRKKFKFQKIFESKKILGKENLGPKIFWVQKIVGPKKSLKNILSQKFLVLPLPYDIELSKVGWIGRGGLALE